MPSPCLLPMLALAVCMVGAAESMDSAGAPPSLSPPVVAWQPFLPAARYFRAICRVAATLWKDSRTPQYLHASRCH